jgi:hypothetical protein
MTKKQAKEGLVSRLAGAFEKHGFKFLKSRGVFLGQNKDFNPSFSLSEVDTGNGVEIRPMAGLRAEQVEGIVNRAAADVDPTAAKYGATLGSEIGRISGEIDRWRPMVKTEQDFDSAAALLTEAFTERALPFYEKYSKLAAIDQHVNSDPEKPAMLCAVHMHRAQVGVVVARLLHRPDLPRLIDGHRRFLRFIDERDLPEFENFLARLEELGD